MVRYAARAVILLAFASCGGGPAASDAAFEGGAVAADVAPQDQAPVGGLDGPGGSGDLAPAPGDLLVAPDLAPLSGDAPADLPGIADASVPDAVLAGDSGAGELSPDAAACTPRRCGHEIACGVAADGCGGSLTCDPCPDVGRTLRLAGARHMVLDKARGVAYVTMPANHPMYPNSVVVVQPTPTMPRVMASVAVGSEPNVLALSQDGSRLWVGLDGDYALRKLELGAGAPVAGPQYKLPGGFNYPHQTQAAALEALPGNPDSVVAALRGGTSAVGVVVIDNGVARGGAVLAYATCLAVGRSGEVFGADGQTTGYGFYSFQVTAQGLTKKETPKLLTSFTRQLVFSHDRVYSEGGDVIDVSAPLAPVYKGKLPTWGSPRPLPDDPTRALLLSGGPRDGDAILRMVDATTFAAKAMVSIAGTTGYYMRDMDLLGKDTIVFLAEELLTDLPTRLVVARTSLLP